MNALAARPDDPRIVSALVDVIASLPAWAWMKRGDEAYVVAPLAELAVRGAEARVVAKLRTLEAYVATRAPRSRPPIVIA